MKLTIDTEKEQITDTVFHQISDLARKGENSIYYRPDIESWVLYSISMLQMRKQTSSDYPDKTEIAEYLKEHSPIDNIDGEKIELAINNLVGDGIIESKDDSYKLVSE